MVESGLVSLRAPSDCPYEVLTHVLASASDRRKLVGSRGECRYCGCVDPQCFKKAAHTFPEGLGNRWVFSLDECDTCNALFSAYETALIASVGSFLTLGGVRGKSGVRQTGHPNGNAYLCHSRADGKRLISASARERDAPIAVDPRTAAMVLDMPIANEKFRPRHAYKALSKMAYALLPEEERSHYTQLQAWLLDKQDRVEFPVLEVALSFSMVGNAPLYISGTLLRRSDPSAPVPYIQFLLAAGSVCMQIDLMSDHLEDGFVFAEVGAVPIRWSTHVLDNAGVESLSWTYSNPVYFNWSSTDAELQPIEAMRMRFDPRTTEATFEPRFRESDLLVENATRRARMTTDDRSSS